MRWNAILPAQSSNRPRGLGFAVLISAALHGLIGLGLWTLPSVRPHASDDAPLAEIPVVVVPDEPMIITLSPVASPTPGGTTSNEPRSEPSSTPIRVEPLPLDSGTSTSSADVPRVVTRTNTAGGKATRGGPEFFGVPVQARTIVFIIDRSISMGINDGLAAAKRELLAHVERLPGTTRFQVFFYNRDVELIPSTESDHLLANTEETRQHLVQLVKRISAKGSTEHLPALRRALMLQPEAILFMTDAQAFEMVHVRAITAASSGRTAIHTLLWCTTDSEPLRELARQNRGIYRRLAEASAAH
jgi:hypothetical protein